MSRPPRQGEAVDAEAVVADRRERRERPTNTRPTHDLPPLAPVAVRMESLLTWVAERTAKFPRDSKFTVGDHWLEACLDVQTAADGGDAARGS